MIPASAEGVLAPSAICVVIMVGVRIRASWLAGLAVAAASAVELAAGTLAASLVAFAAGRAERRRAARLQRRAAARAGRPS